MKSQLRKRFRLTWFVLAIVAIQVALLALSVAFTAALPAITNGLAGAATLVLAGLTVLVLVYNAGVLDATRESAQATRDEAEATREEARATRDQAEATREQAEIGRQSLEELRRNREMDAQPIVVRLEMATHSVQGKTVRDMQFTNIGRGPALNCIYLREGAGDKSEYMRTGLFNLAAGQQIAVPAEQHDLLVTQLFAATDLPREALFCQDQFGNSFRFTPGRARPDLHRWSESDFGSETEPGWVHAFNEWLALREPEPEPEAGPGFIQAVHIHGNYSNSHSTVVWERVPVTDLEPSDSDVDKIQEWLLSMEPKAKRAGPEVSRWSYPSGGMNEEWWARISAGPTVAVSSINILKSPRPGAGGSQIADLSLVDLVTWWQVMAIGARRVARALHVDRVRLGLTVVMSGSHDQPHFHDVDFGIIPRPRQETEPDYYVQHWSGASRPFHVAEWPEQFLRECVRQVLRRFGYRQTEEVIAQLPLGRPSSDPPDHPS